MKRWQRNGVVILVLAASLGGVSRGQAEAKARPLQEVEILSSRSGVSPGQTLDLALRVKLHESFHVNSHNPRQKFLIPTDLELDSPPELDFSPWIFPVGEDRTFPFSPEPLLVYEGEFLIRGRVRIPDGTPPGHLKVVARLRYQACTPEKCLAPRREDVKIELDVVAPGTPTRTLHPEIFPPGSR